MKNFGIKGTSIIAAGLFCASIIASGLSVVETGERGVVLRLGRYAGTMDEGLNFKIPMVKVQTMADIIEVYKWLVSSDEAKNYETICIDSLSEIGEVVLADAKTRFKDARMAYGEMYERLENLVRKFRDINGKNIYMTAKCERVRDEADGCLKNAPAMPGAKLGGKLPYFFDEVFYLGVSKDTENKTFRYLQTQPSFTHMAKDRSGVLDENETPNLTKIFNKITQS